MYSWSEYFHQISLFLTSCGRQHGVANQNYCEYAIEHLSVISQGLSNVLSAIRESNSSTLIRIQQEVAELQQVVNGICRLFIRYHDSLDDSRYHYAVPLQYSGRPGRPLCLIDREQLEYMRSLSFSWAMIGRMLIVSRSTLYRRRVEFGLNGTSESPISDHDLNQLVHQTITQHPYVGQSFVWGVLRSQGYHVTRERVRQVLRRQDPLGTASRWGAYCYC